MLETKIATILNEQIVPNVFGGDEGNIISEDLRNIVDLGTKMADASIEDVKDYSGRFVVGVANEFIPLIPLARMTYGMIISSEEYAGLVQRIRARFTKTYDTPILSLEDYNADSSAPDYNDGHYYGVPFDAKLYTKTSTFMVPYSIPVEMFKKSFMTKEGVLSLVSLIENAITNTIENELSALAKGILRKMILATHGTREIHLITMYNNEFGFESGDDGFVSLTTWKNDTNFKLWCQETIIRLKKAITDYSIGVYNNGDVECRVDENDTRIVMLNEFATALDFANANVYHNELVSGWVGGSGYYNVNYWQTPGKDLLPTIGEGSVHDSIMEVVKDSGSGKDVTISHVVSVIYSRFSCGMRTRLNKTTSDYIAKGDFNNFFHHFALDTFIDERDITISLVLD